MTGWGQLRDDSSLNLLLDPHDCEDFGSRVQNQKDKIILVILNHLLIIHYPVLINREVKTLACCCGSNISRSKQTVVLQIWQKLARLSLSCALLHSGTKL